jgi:hypothetical protein
MATRVTTPGTGYQRSNGQYSNTEVVTLLGSTAFAEGTTIGDAVDIGGAGTVRLDLVTTAKSGTSPTLDVTVQTSKDPSYGWRTVAAFDQQTNTSSLMSAVTSAGTSPPVITLTGTPAFPMDLKVDATLDGARGTWTFQWSVDDGLTWEATGVVSAATVALTLANGTSTGITLNIATGSATASDNVWTARVGGLERKSFAGCDRYVRAVAVVGGSSTPIMTASCIGETCGGG